jgi:hypothetical protein
MSHFHFVNHKSHGVNLELNLGVLGEKPATNRVRNEAAKMSASRMVQEEKE